MNDANDAFQELITEVKNNQLPLSHALIEDWHGRFESHYRRDVGDWLTLINIMAECIENCKRGFSAQYYISRLAFIGGACWKHLDDRVWDFRRGRDNALKYVRNICWIIKYVAENQWKFPQIVVEKVLHQRKPFNSYDRTLFLLCDSNECHLRDEGFYIVSSGKTIEFGLCPSRIATDDEMLEEINVWPDARSAWNMPLENAWWENCSRPCLRASIAMYERSLTLESFNSAEFRRWACCLCPENGFLFCWQLRTLMCQKPGHGASFTHSIICDELRECLASGKQFLVTPWMQNTLELSQTLFSLLGIGYARPKAGSDEASIRQVELLAKLLSVPSEALFEGFIFGFLDWCKDYWDVLDPVILGLPTDRIVALLECYSTQPKAEHSHYHAKVLLAHLRGESNLLRFSIRESRGGLLPSIEGLVAASGSHFQQGMGLWLGQPSLERLWLGAIQSACSEFSEYFSSQWGHDEHEHVAVLIDTLARRLKETNSTLREWFQTSKMPCYINTSIRRFPKTARAGLPQEGGETGYQADLAIIMKCRLPEVVTADRATLIQAKKLEQTRSANWSNRVKVDATQLRRLLAISPQAYYLFLTPVAFASEPLVLPARYVQDILNAQQSVPSIPLDLLLRVGKSLPHFVLNDVIGLWTGDTNQDLLDRISKGEESGQSPRIVIEVTVGRENSG